MLLEPERLLSYEQELVMAQSTAIARLEGREIPRPLLFRVCTAAWKP